MPSGLTASVIVVIVLALSFDFINGFHDTANSIATGISTRAIPPKVAILIAATFNFLGALASTNVARTISKGIVSGTVPQFVIIATLISAIIWNLLTWYFGIPSSSSHALIGSLVGANIAYVLGFKTIIWSGVLEKVVLPLFTSPILGFIVGYFLMSGLFEALRKLSQHTVNRWFSKLQWLSSIFLSFSHGGNDAQKSMGIITMALYSAGVISTNAKIPTVVILMCALAMALGTSIGGWKIIKTIGLSMFKMKPVNGFAAEATSALIIETASRLGAPVSTTHVMSSAIMGVGAAKRFSAVNWGVARNIVWTWVITLPSSMLMGAIITFIIKAFLH